MTLAEAQELDRGYVMPTYARHPVEFVRGEGSRLWDSNGDEYLDFLGGISVAQVGHCHPHVVEAVTTQAARLMHVGNLYYTAPGLRLAERLSRLSLGGSVFFSNSGAEANECAIKLLRRRRRGGEIVVVEGGFAGRTLGALSATPQRDKQEPFEPLVPGFRVAPRDDPEALAAAIGPDVAGVVIEPVQGESGIHPLAPEVLQAARRACDAAGALLVFDEIQCGMGRSGRMWAWEHAGVRPDVMTLAKGLGGGLPIGATVTSPEHAAILGPGDHGSTFAGGPVVAAAANAVLDVLEEEGLIAAARDRGAELADGLSALGLEVRGSGLMLAFETPDAPAFARRLLLEQRLVVNATGPTAVRLLPPLTVSGDEVLDAVGRIEALLGSRA